MLALLFVLGYIFIAIEHTIKIDKAAIALLTGVSCWVLLILGKNTIIGPEATVEEIDGAILHHIGEIAEILFFLLGAMTIVELIDSHDGFSSITSRVTTTNRVKLLWVLCIITFFLSAILDNLTTAIVMAALLKKLLNDKEDLWFFAGMIIIAANAGGAWSPIGDVTTIMLWIGGQITATNIVAKVFVPSLICLLIPLVIVSFFKKGNITSPEAKPMQDSIHLQSSRESNIVLILGVLGLLFVPIFKNLTHLPPFMGMLFSLGVLWVVTELLHKNKEAEAKSQLTVASVIRRVDTPSVLFFLGILLAVASLQTGGQLQDLSLAMSEKFSSIYTTNILIGLLSSIVDNVPLVAGAMGMYDFVTYPQDHVFWELLAYCAGTGGSVLIIGSAAGVAIMGILKIDFIWYLKNVSWLAIVGYFSGVLVYYLIA